MNKFKFKFFLIVVSLLNCFNIAFATKTTNKYQCQAIEKKKVRKNKKYNKNLSIKLSKKSKANQNINLDEHNSWEDYNEAGKEFEINKSDIEKITLELDKKKFKNVSEMALNKKPKSKKYNINLDEKKIVVPDEKTKFLEQKIVTKFNHNLNRTTKKAKYEINNNVLTTLQMIKNNLEDFEKSLNELTNLNTNQINKSYLNFNAISYFILERDIKNFKENVLKLNNSQMLKEAENFEKRLKKCYDIFSGICEKCKDETKNQILEVPFEKEGEKLKLNDLEFYKEKNLKNDIINLTEKFKSFNFKETNKNVNKSDKNSNQDTLDHYESWNNSSKSIEKNNLEFYKK